VISQPELISGKMVSYVNITDLSSFQVYVFVQSEAGFKAVSAVLKVNVEYDCDWDNITFNYDSLFLSVIDQETPAIILTYD
jgi:hypothetical protein